MVSRWRMGVVVSSAMLLSACGGGGGGEVNGDVLVGKQTTYSIGGTLSLENTPSGTIPPAIKLVNTLSCPSSSTTASCSGPTLTALGNFTFASLASQSSYQIEVRPQPSGYSCRVLNGNGRIETAAVNDIEVICAAGLFSIHGTVMGLGSTNPGLQISNNTDTLSISSDGPFTFSAANNSVYNIRIAREHDHYQCTLLNPGGTVIPIGSSISGTINAADISGISISCAAPIRATITGLESTHTIQLTNNYALPNLTAGTSSFTATGNVTRAFDLPLPAGSSYSVTASNGPANYNCTVANGAGNVGATAINISVNCVERTYTIGGSTTGLSTTNTGLTLRREASGYSNEDLIVTAPATNSVVQNFTFLTAVRTSTPFTLSIINEPNDRVCSFANNTITTTGTVNAAPITDIAINCTPVVALTLSNTTPSNNASGISRTVSPSLTFSAVLNGATVSSSTISLSSSAGSHSSALSHSGNQVTVQPARKLFPLARYTLNADVALRGVNRERPLSPLTSTFVTRDGVWEASTSVRPETALVYWSYPQAVLNDSGSAFSIWWEQTGVRANRYTSNGGWEEPELMSISGGGNAYSPDVAVDRNGNAIAVWQQSDGTRFNIYFNRYNAGAGWSGAQLLESDNTGDAGTVRVAMDSNGNAVSAWLQTLASGTQIVARRYNVDTGWEAVTPLGDNPQYNSPELDVAPNGDALVLWGGSTAITFSRYSEASGWSPAASVAAGFPSPSQPVLAMNANGAAVAIWMEAAEGNIWVSRFTVASSWTAPETIASGTAGGQDRLTLPQIAMDAKGNALAVWAQINTLNTLSEPWSRRFTVGTGWSNPVRIPANNIIQFDLAMDEIGNGLFVYSNGSVHALRYHPVDGWGTTIDLSNDNSYNTAQPRISLNSVGDAITVWDRYYYSGASYSIWSAIFR